MVDVPITDLSKLAGFGYKFGSLGPVSGLIVHHTGGRGSPEGVIRTFQQRNFPAQYVMDREGKVYQTLPDGARGQQIKQGQGVGAGLSNANTLGIEVIAKDDNDWTPAQLESMGPFVTQVANKYGFDAHKNVWGHGEINPHKQATEGMAFVNRWRGLAGAPPVSDEAATAVATAMQPPSSNFSPPPSSPVQPAPTMANVQNKTFDPVSDVMNSARGAFGMAPMAQPQPPQQAQPASPMPAGEPVLAAVAAAAAPVNRTQNLFGQLALLQANQPQEAPQIAPIRGPSAEQANALATFLASLKSRPV